jgi:hypothetical protein
VPINTSELKIYFLSSDKEAMGTKVSVTGLIDAAVQTSQLYPGKYVADAYDNDWYIRCITVHNNEECGILLKFMERKGKDILTFSWPQTEDKCHIPFFHVLCTVPALSLYGRSKQQYRHQLAVTVIACKNFLQYIEKGRV